MLKKMNVAHIILIFFILLQCSFWLFKTSKIKPDFTITPLPPSNAEMSIFSFGDNELLYRIYGFQLQNAGDTFGETIPLKDYDYSKLEKWFYALNELDNISNYVPSIAGFYYSMSQNASDNKYIVDYLIDFADKNPVKNWRWYLTAMYLTKSKLQDEQKAFKIAEKISKIENNNNEVPPLTRFAILMLFNEKDLSNCEIVKNVYTLIAQGELEKILSDAILTTGGDRNPLYLAIKHKLDLILKNKDLLKRCLNK